MDITTKNAKFQEKSMIFLDYLLIIQKAHDIFNIRLDSFITVHMSWKNLKKEIFYIFSLNELVYLNYIFDLICMLTTFFLTAIASITGNHHLFPFLSYRTAQMIRNNNEAQQPENCLRRRLKLFPDPILFSWSL